MATNGYPKVGGAAWRILRTKASSAPSTKFTPSNVAALLGMATPDSARNNIVLPLRRLGLIDDEGSLTARGNKWRSDASYAEACQEILDEVYPDDLLALTDDDGTPDQQKVKTWFEHKGFGDSNARQMSTTYSFIAGKQIPEAPTNDPAKATGSKPAKAKASAKAGSKAASRIQHKVDDQPPGDSRGAGSPPDVHLDIQIHIPADASAEQIDHIFASMAKHLYNR